MTQAIRGLCIVVLVGASLIGCSDFDPVFNCTQDSNCDFSPDGKCLTACSGQKYCAEPVASVECSSELRWINTRSSIAGEGLAGLCVESAHTCEADAGVEDGGIADASADDGGMPDAMSPDGQTITDAGVTDAGGPVVNAVEVPAGSFPMGCDSGEVGCVISFMGLDPKHTVSLNTYYIDVTEVTEGAYHECVLAGSCTAPNVATYLPKLASYPVVKVTWDQANTFCTTWVGGRLPTEAEWEKAARGVAGNRYPWGTASATCTLANGSGCGGVLHPVGVHLGGNSPYGVQDMAGNASEWVADWWDGEYYDTSPGANPTGPSSGAEKVVRGGSYVFGGDKLYTFGRSRFPPGTNTVDGGFRCAYDSAP